jgi:hypothetical protein
MFDKRACAARPSRGLIGRVCLGAAVSLSLASAALADPSESGPRSLAPGDIEAWIALHIEPAGWRYLSFDGDGAYFLSPDAAWRTAQGNWRFVIREELFRPEGGAQSMVMQTEVDCDGRKLRLPGVRAYRLHNMKGPPEDRGQIRQWVTPETPGESAQMAKLCGLAKEATTPPPPADTPPPQSASAADVQGWVDRYLDLSGWRVVETVSDGVNLVAASGATRTPQGALRIWSRAEFFRPQAYPAGGPMARSARQLMELDCKAARVHIVEVVAYAQNNLKGSSTPPLTVAKAPWEAPAPGTREAKVIQSLCQVAGAQAPPIRPHVKRVRRRTAPKSQVVEPKTLT